MVRQHVGWLGVGRHVTSSVNAGTDPPGTADKTLFLSQPDFYLIVDLTRLTEFGSVVPAHRPHTSINRSVGGIILLQQFIGVLRTFARVPSSPALLGWPAVPDLLTGLEIWVKERGSG